jgi:hypothetical protein
VTPGRESAAVAVGVPGSSAPVSVAAQGTTGFGNSTAGSGVVSDLQPGSGSNIAPGSVVADQSMVISTSLPKRPRT